MGSYIRSRSATGFVWKGNEQIMSVKGYIQRKFAPGNFIIFPLSSKSNKMTSVDLAN